MNFKKIESFLVPLNQLNENEQREQSIQSSLVF